MFGLCCIFSCDLFSIEFWGILGILIKRIRVKCVLLLSHNWLWCVYNYYPDAAFALSCFGNTLLSRVETEYDVYIVSPSAGRWLGADCQIIKWQDANLWVIVMLPYQTLAKYRKFFILYNAVILAEITVYMMCTNTRHYEILCFCQLHWNYLKSYGSVIVDFLVFLIDVVTCTSYLSPMFMRFYPQTLMFHGHLCLISIM